MRSIRTVSLISEEIWRYELRKMRMLMIACGVSVSFLRFFRKYWDCFGVER